jgi:hypothetical protein
MKKRLILLVCVFCSILVIQGSQAQDLEESLSLYLSTNGSLYMQPLADAFGANLNSGFFHTARIKKMGFHLHVGFKAVGALISDDQKTFTSKAEGGLPGGRELPTVFGDEDGVYIDEIDETVTGVWNTSIFPVAVPQLTVGSLLGTEVTIRWMEWTVSEDFGKIGLFGFGIRHSISQYIPMFPVDVAIGYFRQNFEIGDIVEAHAQYFGLQASYQISVLCFYGGIGYENANLDISYTYEDNDTSQRVSFELDSKNSTRFTIGLGFDLPILKIHVDYNIAAQNVVAAGIGFGF